MGTGGKLKLEEGTAGGTHVGFKAPDTEVPVEIIWELPDADGSPGQFWMTDGAGNLIWTDNSTLQANITAENTARIASDSTLQSNLNAEITARMAADSTLQVNLNSEITARMAADSTLQTNLQANLNSEITARIDADSTLQSAVNGLATIIFTTSSIGVASGQTIGCNTSGGSITLTAPLSPTQGQRFRVLDIKGMAATNNIVIARNGSNIAELAADFIIDTNWFDLMFVYYDSTVGWAPIH